MIYFVWFALLILIVVFIFLIYTIGYAHGRIDSKTHQQKKRGPQFVVNTPKTSAETQAAALQTMYSCTHPIGCTYCAWCGFKATDITKGD